jgi:hypothetical protein
MQAQTYELTAIPHCNDNGDGGDGAGAGDGVENLGEQISNLTIRTLSIMVLIFQLAKTKAWLSWCCKL